MAKAVTLKNKSGEEVYPVTDASLVNGSLGQSQIASNAITAAKIVDGAVTSSKLDWANAQVVFNSYNSKGDKTVDVSMMPTGAKFIVLINGYVQTAANQVFYISASYGSQEATSTWSDNKHSSVYSRAMVNMNQFTKEAGNNQLTIRIGQSAQAATECIFSAIVMRVG